MVLTKAELRQLARAEQRRQNRLLGGSLTERERRAERAREGLGFVLEAGAITGAFFGGFQRRTNAVIRAARTDKRKGKRKRKKRKR